MKNKIIFCFIVLLTLFLTISAISASENETCDNLTATADDSVSQDEIELENVIGDVKSSTEISASDKSTHVDTDDVFTVKLTSGGKGLANKKVLVTINDVKYDKTTDSNGKVNVNFKLKSGTYTVRYSFAGDENYTSSSGTSKITVKADIKTYLKVVNKNVEFREGKKTKFQLKLLDSAKKAIANKQVTVKVAGKKYTAKTNSKGVATFNLNLKEGSYKLKYYFFEDGRYRATSGNLKILVKPDLTHGNGYWVNQWDMKKISLKKLSKLGTKHIFLLCSAFTLHGKKAVVNWMAKANKYGIKVHIWIPVFFDGYFISPVTKNGNFNTKYMNYMIKKAKNYAKIKGVGGIHFDYLRFSGTAYRYKNSVKAVNYFAKKASSQLHKMRPDLIVSAALMPEPNGMKYYYAQDVPTLSKYLDVIVPMVYKGNYHAGTKWIKQTTRQFVKMSKGAKVWCGLQGYRSDSNIREIPYKELFNDAKAAKRGGACGVISFRWGLSALLNFKKL